MAGFTKIPYDAPAGYRWQTAADGTQTLVPLETAPTLGPGPNAWSVALNPGQPASPPTSPAPNGGFWYQPSTSGGMWQDATAQTPAATPPPATTPPAASSGGGGNSTLPPGSIGSLLTPFTGTPPSYVTPDDAAGSLPQAPAFPTLPQFQAPTEAEAAAQPGYQFAFDQGENALMDSAAARGVTNTGGSLLDAINYGQQAATQNYQNVFNNDLTSYGTNLQSQYLMPYAAAQANWNTLLPASQTAASNQNSFNWNDYLQNYNIYRNQKNDTYNMLYGLSSLGATVQ